MTDTVIWSRHHGHRVEEMERLKQAGFHVRQLEDRPSIIGYEWLWEAYCILNTCRPSGMAPAPIPWDKIVMYAQHRGMTAEETYILEEVIMGVDSAYLKDIAEDNEAERKRKQSKGLRK